MAPKGLPSVEAKFTADNSDYIEAISEMIKKNKEMIVSIEEVNRTIRSIGDAADKLDGKTVTIFVKYVTMGDMPDPGDITRTITYVTKGDIREAIPDDSLSKINAVSDALDGVGDAMKDAGDSADFLKKNFDDLRMEAIRDGIRNMGTDLGDVADKLQASSDAVDVMKKAWGDVGTELAKAAVASGELMPRALDAMSSSVDDVGMKIDSLSDRFAIASLSAMKAANAVAAAAQVARAAAPAVWSPYGPGGGVDQTIPWAKDVKTSNFGAGVWPAATQEFLQSGIAEGYATHAPYSGGTGGDILAQAAADALLTQKAIDQHGAAIAGLMPAVEQLADADKGYQHLAGLIWQSAAAQSGLWPAAAQGGGSGGVIVPAGLGKGGGGGAGAFLGTLLGGLGGALGGGGGGGGIGTTGYAAGTAAAHWAAVSSFVKRWYPPVHYAMMAINEILATVGPAAIAGGMAGLVGMEGGQQAYGRFSAVNTAAQALGPIYGGTIGTILGGKVGSGGSLQDYQSRNDMGVYELLGGGINMMRSGAGNPFLQLGQNTLAMFDQATAGLTNELQSGKTQQQIAGIVKNGTGYLQQFGDTLGNIGHTFLNVASNLPGVGGDILSILQGGTKALAATTGYLGSGLAPILAAEAAGRYGSTIVGGAGSLLSTLGGGIGNIGATVGWGLASRGGPLGFLGNLAGAGGGALSTILGTSARKAVAADVGKTVNPLTGAAVAEEGEEIGGTGMAGFLGSLSAWDLAAIGGVGYLAGQGIFGYQTAAQKTIGGRVAAADSGQLFGQPGYGAGEAISAMNVRVPRTQYPLIFGKDTPSWMRGLMGTTGGQGLFNIGQGQTDMWKSIAKGLSGGGFGGVAEGAEETFHGLAQTLVGKQGLLGGIPFLNRFAMAPDPSAYQAQAQATDKLATSYTNMMKAGEQVKGLWKDLSGGAVSTATAMAMMSAANLTLGASFDKNGLTGTSRTQMENLYRGWTAMVGTGAGTAPAISNAVATGYAMNQLQGSKVTALNQTYDAFTQLMTGGATGAGGISQTVASMGKASDVAKALTSFTSSTGASAWNAFASSSTTTPGLITQIQGQFDWLRQAGEMGATKGQKGMAAYELQQALPYASQSPAAAAMVASLGAQFGITKVGQSYSQISQEINKAADGATRFNNEMSKTTAAIANAGKDAGTFTANFNADALADNTANAANAMIAFQSAAKGSAGAQKDLNAMAESLKLSGMNKGTIEAMLKAAGAANGQITIAVRFVYGKSDPPKMAPVSYRIHGVLDQLPKIPPIPPQTYSITGVVTSIVSALPHGGPGGGGSTPANTPAFRNLHLQQGFKVPGGYGGGDIVPAMLEPGEAVVPKHLVPDIAPFLAAHGVPGFEGMSNAAATRALVQKYGSIMNARSVLGFAAGGVVPAGATAAQLHALIDKDYTVLDKLSGTAWSNYWKSTIQPLYDALDKLTAKANTAAAAVNNLSSGGGNVTIHPGAALGGIAALGGSIPNLYPKISGAQTSLANNIAAAAKQGTGYNPWGGGQTLLSTFSGFATPTTTAQGQPYQYYTDQQAVAGGGTLSVQQQMGDYLQAMKSFQGDLGKLSKAGLNKNLLQQLIAAGPLAGDQEAQSILSGAGGVKGANQLWGQINQAANQMGMGAAQDVYAKGKAVKVTADTGAAQAAIDKIHGKTVVISVKLDMGGGGGGGSTNDIDHLVNVIQKKILEQAKRNRGSNLTLRGYGS